MVSRAACGNAGTHPTNQNYFACVSHKCRLTFDSILPVVDAGLVKLVKNDHALNDLVLLLPTPGHTIDHFSVLAGADETVIFHGGHDPLTAAGLASGTFIVLMGGSSTLPLYESWVPALGLAGAVICAASLRGRSAIGRV